MIGLTATPNRMDERSILKIFGKINTKLLSFGISISCIGSIVNEELFDVEFSIDSILESEFECYES